MKKYLVLLFVFTACSVYIFYTNYSSKEESIPEEDAIIHEIPAINIGGTVKEPENNTVSIGKLQTSYIMYTNGDIDFDNMIRENTNNLKHVLNFPFNPLPGYLFSVGYDENSKTQFYYQSNKEETRTVILKVVHSKNGNKVTKMYDGEYFKLVSVDLDNPNQLLAYDYNNDEFVIGVN
ncbi:hypothetical protein [Lysinibacillus xylanilyticus]|uniref:hypothetical protein n=1 Tax=Lysinibacillus xylanilyticus TaxID=582475 RepID=UPI0036DEE4E3